MRPNVDAFIVKSANGFNGIATGVMVHTIAPVKEFVVF